MCAFLYIHIIFGRSQVQTPKLHQHTMATKQDVKLFPTLFLKFFTTSSLLPYLSFIPHLNYKKKITNFSIEIYWMGKITNFSLVLPTVPMVLWSERENLYVLKLNLCTRKIYIFLFVCWGEGWEFISPYKLHYFTFQTKTTTTNPNKFLFVENLGLGEN